MTWPPSKPISILARLLVDQVGPSPGQLRQRGIEVVDLVGDVVHPRAAFRDEAAHRSVEVERCEQLDAAFADPDGGSLDALVLDRRALLELGAEQPLVRRDRGVEVGDRHAEMVDPPGVHSAGDAI